MAKVEGPKGVAADKTMPFRIGSDYLPGLSKLTEECAETLVEIGKIEGLGSMGQHWDGKGSLRVRLEEEIADTIAAQNFVIAKNKLNRKKIKARAKEKLRKFNRWHRNIQKGRSPTDDGD